MITISCYTFHPFIQKFVRLYKRVQVVSAWITFFLSCLCCQCLDGGVPMTNTSSDRALPSPVPLPDTVDDRYEEPAPPSHIVVDFTPSTNNQGIIKERCVKFWDIVKDRPDLEGVMVFPNRKPEAILKDIPEVPVHKKLTASRKKDEKF